MITFHCAFCSPLFLFPDKTGSKNLGKFVSSPSREKGNIQLSYSDGDDCPGGKKITTNVTLVCKPGNTKKRMV
jgi:insulin-like growth factor 2 receptor